MRNVLLAMAVGVTFSGMAQILNVGSIEKVNIPENRDNVVAAISPQGDYRAGQAAFKHAHNSGFAHLSAHLNA